MTPPDARKIRRTMPTHEHKTSAPLRITEVGPRDGLQNEPGAVSMQSKIAFVNALSQTGVKEIEVGAFVSPQAVPQMADTEDVFRKIERRAGVIYSALVPNERGLARAFTAGAQKISVFTAASDTFTQHNINASIEESISRFRPVVAGAQAAGLPVRAYVSTSIYCPYEGRVEPSRVVEVCDRLILIGIREISLGETIGKAAPNDVRRVLDAVLRHVKIDQLSLHFHDTYGMAIANAVMAWEEYGITGFDSSAGGLGGCPYAPGASGNVATEDLVYAFKASGGKVDVDEEKIVEAARGIARVLMHPLSSRLSRALKDTAHPVEPGAP